MTRQRAASAGTHHRAAGRWCGSSAGGGRGGTWCPSGARGRWVDVRRTGQVGVPPRAATRDKRRPVSALVVGWVIVFFLISMNVFFRIEKVSYFLYVCFFPIEKVLMSYICEWVYFFPF